MGRTGEVVVRARVCDPSVFFDERRAFNALVKGYATWATKLLGLPRRLCLEDPVKCLVTAMNALLAMEVCSVRAADKVSARCLARLVCAFVGGGVGCVEKVAGILLGAED